MKYLTLLLCLCLLAGCQYKESPIKDYGVYVEIETPEPIDTSNCGNVYSIKAEELK